jgi:hypothetical protein
MNVRPFGSLKLLVEKSFKICVFSLFFSAIKENYFTYLKKNQHQMKEKDIL